MSQKGSSLEELVRAFFSQQGFFCLRGASFIVEGQEVTDIDVWLYGKQGASVRTRAIIDVKNKKSPKALERIIWVKGMQAALKCDRALIATTENDPRVARFAKQQGIGLLSKAFITRLEKGVEQASRLSEEDAIQSIKSYPFTKEDGDWIKILQSVRSALISSHGFSAFNHALAAFRIFSQKVKTRPQHAEQALRCVYVTASVACIALDSALSGIVYDSQESRYESILGGVTYGDDGGRIQATISTVLEVIAGRIENGKVVSARAKDALDSAFADVRGDIIAEFFSRDQSGVNLFRVARALDERAHARDLFSQDDLATDEKMVLGVFSDFVGLPRSNLLGRTPHMPVGNEVSLAEKEAKPKEDEDSSEGGQAKLI